MDWKMAKEATKKGTNKCYLYGMGTDLTDDQIAVIMLAHAKLSSTLCMLAARQPCVKEFISLYDWHVILRTEQENEQP